MTRGDVAIIGMSCLFPSAPNLETYWANILSGLDAITDPPPGAWGVDVLYDPDADSNDRIYCKRGGFLGALADFDPIEHGVMPLAVQGGEPDQWLALRVARGALADAGLGDEIPERHRTAVILGKGTYLNRGNLNIVQHGGVVDQTLQILSKLHPEYTEEELDLIRHELKGHLPPFSPDSVPGLIPNITAGRIANRLDLMGPSYTVDGACASSLLALDMAVGYLATGQCDLALVGGVHVVTPLPISLVFCQLGALSRRQQIRPFDKEADGTILGEGVGMVVLKRLEDAQRDRQRIYAVIRGLGVASDGRGLSVTAPRAEGQILALERAYQQSGVSPHTIGLIEAHGTATPVGDITEIASLTRVFGEREGAPPRCAVGSVKSMLGHLMPAAGIASLIKTALALYHKVLPPTLNVDEPNPALDLAKTPFYINTQTRPWIHGGTDAARRAGVNAFGFGGINVHAILEEYPVTAGNGGPPGQPDWDSEVLILSAASRTELIEQIQRFRRFLQAAPGLRLKDLAFTVNVPLPKESYRVGIVASTAAELGEKLERTLSRLSDPDCQRIKELQGVYFFERPPGDPHQLGFMFPGEGSQYLNMLADLCIRFPEVRESFDLIDRVFATHERDYLPSDFIFPPPAFSRVEREAASRRLWRMEGAVEAVLTASRGLATLMGQLGIQPTALVGHSTGEYSAMVASGMIDLQDEGQVGQFAIELSRMYQSASVEGAIPRATLLAVGASAESLLDALDGNRVEVHVAMENCPHQTVIAVEENSLPAVEQAFQRHGLIFERLPFDRPYHTPLFDAYASRLKPFFERWLSSPPWIKTYSCTTASPFPDDVVACRRVAVDHWRQPVAFGQTIEAMYADGIRLFVEVGPKGILSSFVDDVLRGRPHLAVPVDVANRTGTTQLNHLVALLATHGVSMQLDLLYTGRSPRRLDLDKPQDTADSGRERDHRVQIETGWPALDISSETVARLHRAAPAPASTEGPVASPPRRGGSRGGDGIAQVMSAHLETMEQFLAVQQEVMQAFLSQYPPLWAETKGGRADPVSLVGDAASPDPPPAPVEPTPAPRPPAVQAGQPGIVTESSPLADQEHAGSDDEWARGASGEYLTDVKTIQALLLQLVSQRTGYPVEMIDPDLNLEADLGIDSIKRVEILGSFRQQTGLVKAEEIEALAGCTTLRQVVDLLSKASPPLPTPPLGGGPRAGLPFIREILSLQEGETMVARCQLTLDEDLFLRHHTIGRDVSVTDPELTGLPVVPLTMSMELMAQAAAVLVPGRHLSGMRDVHAHRWIALEEERLTLELRAQRQPSSSGDGIRVQIFEADRPANQDETPIVEGTMLFDERYPEPPSSGPFTLREERPSRWRPERLYQDLMFHGSAFQGVVSMDRWGQDGAVATLQVLPHHPLLSSDPDPVLMTDPILLDQPGQVVGFWMDEHVDLGYVVFPFALNALHLYGPPLPSCEQVKCQARIRRLSEWQVASDLDVVREDGAIWARLEGWQDWRFDLPRTFVRFLLAPGNEVLSVPWATPIASLPEPERFQAYRLRLDAFPEGFFTAHGAIWQRVLSHLVLSRRERQVWKNLKTPPARRVDWLLGRVVAKDAVRQHLRDRYGLALCPADIEIAADAQGRPIADGAWKDEIAHVPILSLSHTNGVAAAIAGDGDAGAGVGIDIETLGAMREETGHLAFTPDEQTLLNTVSGSNSDGWPLRLWCAKEAVAKALGQGLAGGPRSLVAHELDTDTGRIYISLEGELARRLSATEKQTFAAHTTSEEDLVVATSLYQDFSQDGDHDDNA